MGNLLRWSNQGDRPDDIWVCMLSDLFKNVGLSDQTQVFDFQSMKRLLGRGLEELMKPPEQLPKRRKLSKKCPTVVWGRALQRIVVHPKGAFPG